MSKRILIVEDELPIAELEKDYLELSDLQRWYRRYEDGDDRKI